MPSRSHAWRGAIVLATLFSAAAALAACSSDATTGGPDASTPAADGGALDGKVSDATGPAQDGERVRPKAGTIGFTVKRGAPSTSALAVAAFTEFPPKSKPPQSFDTTKTPTFPYVGKLTGLEPGRYWLIAVLDNAPATPGAITPGPEDEQAASGPVDIVGDETQDVVLDLDGARDGGADGGSLDAARD